VFIAMNSGGLKTNESDDVPREHSAALLLGVRTQMCARIVVLNECADATAMTLTLPEPVAFIQTLPIHGDTWIVCVSDAGAAYVYSMQTCIVKHAAHPKKHSVLDRDQRSTTSGSSTIGVSSSSGGDSDQEALLCELIDSNQAYANPIPAPESSPNPTFICICLAGFSGLIYECHICLNTDLSILSFALFDSNNLLTIFNVCTKDIVRHLK